MSDTIRILFVGDIVGEPGLAIVDTLLPALINKHKPNFIIVNGENSHDGMGINESIVKRLYRLGVHVITGGNHSFAKWKVFPYMKTDKTLLRPHNYPEGAPGHGYGVFPIPGTDLKIGVMNLQGRTFMHAIDDPFRMADKLIDEIKEQTNLIFLDFHAEATAEKMAMAWHIDGKASVMVGTHTHIPTNDYRIMAKGMGYITDVGMTGSYNSIIGMEKAAAMKRFLYSLPEKYTGADGDNRLCGIIADVDKTSGKCKKIEPILFPGFKSEV